MNIDFEALKIIFLSGLDRLKNFNFSISNSVFLLLFVILFLILLIFWEIRKAFSFSLIIAIILLTSTKTENYILTDILGQSTELSDINMISIVVRGAAIVIIVFIFLYYSLIRRD